MGKRTREKHKGRAIIGNIPDSSRAISITESELQGGVREGEEIGRVNKTVSVTPIWVVFKMGVMKPGIFTLVLA